MPFAKTGGLADVAGALPRALREAGAGPMLVMPLYEQVDRALLDELVFDNLEVEWRGRVRRASVLYSFAAGAPAFLIDAPDYFARPSIYGFADDHERFAFFCHATLALLKRIGEPPDILHVNDWPCGFASVELQRTRRANDPFFARTRSLFSIHNLAYQGAFDPNDLRVLGFGSQEETNAFLLNGAASALKAGLMTSDALSTVSRRYALEIQTPEQGYGLDWLLRARSDRLVGITNGVDYNVWNPETDPHIAAHFNADDLTGKRQCKLDLLRRFGLPEETERPVIAIISRLVAQKGYDLIREVIGDVLNTGAFFIALGAGAREYEDFLQALHDQTPQRVGVYIGYAGEPLAHQIEAGADIFLMPSLYEPCGLNQMYSMRYGTVPVVRATGGLEDTIDENTGFKFRDYNGGALLHALGTALHTFRSDKPRWASLMRNGMRRDHSWAVAASEYRKLYRRVLST